jgi:hypothetical protein
VVETMLLVPAEGRAVCICGSTPLFRQHHRDAEDTEKGNRGSTLMNADSRKIKALCFRPSDSLLCALCASVVNPPSGVPPTFHASRVPLHVLSPCPLSRISAIIPSGSCPGSTCDGSPRARGGLDGWGEIGVGEPDCEVCRFDSSTLTLPSTLTGKSKRKNRGDAEGCH